MGIDEVREGIRAAQESAQAALTAIEATKSQLDEARPVLMESLTGSRHPKAATVEVDLAQAVEACEEIAKYLREGSGKFDDYLGTL